MKNRLIVLTVALAAATAFSPALRAQTGAGISSKTPDLSGAWLRKQGFQSVSNSDPGGNKRGKETDIPYQPWALAKTLSERPPTGPDNQFEDTTDPWINYCEPPGLFRVYMEPGRTAFVQTKDAVYILHEVMQAFRIVRLNSKHPADPDPTWWGDSIGWYENGDTLVVDTIGANGKTWLDQLGHPSTEKLHMIERYHRLDATTMELDAMIDDPGAYTAPFHSKHIFITTAVPFMSDSWVCSVRENKGFYDNLYKPAVPPPAK